MTGTNKKRVMIVEDEAIVALDIRDSIAQLGYDIAAVVASGEEAVKQAAEERPDIILMDITLAGQMNGIEAAERIQRSHDIPVVYLTAHTDAGSIEGAKITAPFGYLVKPCDMFELRAVIETALYKHEMDIKWKEAKRFLESMFSSISDLILVLDRDLRVVMSNWKGADDISVQQRQANPHCYVSFMHRQSPCGSCRVSEVFRKGAPATIEMKNTVDGTVHRAIASPIMNREGQVEYVVEVISDITDWIRMEERVRNAQKLESIGTLAGGIAHDFNNLLSSILGNIGFVKMMLDPDDRKYHLIQLAERSCTEAAELSSRLLTFSSGGAPLMQKLSIQELMKDSAELTLSGTGITVSFNIQQDISPVVADRVQMMQVFNNIFTNAREAMPDGGAIEVFAENIVLTGDEGTVPLTGKYVRIEIRDNGEGIPEDLIERIFDPYFTTKDMSARKGQGLGLSICHSIIKRHNGTITVRSAPGKGTAFTIILSTNPFRRTTVSSGDRE